MIYHKRCNHECHIQCGNNGLTCMDLIFHTNLTIYRLKEINTIVEFKSMLVVKFRYGQNSNSTEHQIKIASVTESIYKLENMVNCPWYNPQQETKWNTN